MDEFLGHSVRYRTLVGPYRGRNAFTLHTLVSLSEPPEHVRLAKAAGFSLHCGVAASAQQREKLERLCRYISSGLQ